MATKATLTLDFEDANADNTLSVQRLQNRVDGNVAGQKVTAQVTDNGSTATVDFDDVIADEQILAAFEAAVNLAGTPGSGFVVASPSLSGSVSSGSRERRYAV